LGREESLPDHRVLALERFDTLRYGENPHQSGAAYRIVGEDAWWETARVLQGKEMSFNNYVDADAAWSHVHAFDEPACVIVKHTNPCGVAVAHRLVDAFARAWDCDPTSAFGSVIAVNRPLDDATAAAMLDAGFIEVVVAPAVVDEAVLAVRRNLRVVTGPAPRRPGLDLRRCDGGFLVQEWDTLGDESAWQVVSERPPTDDEWGDLRFAWKVAANTKSNAVVVAAGGTAVGIGAGDQSRVGATERALRQAGERSRRAVAASDAFFPFRDGPDALAAAGVTAIIQPGGSVRDDEVVAAAGEHGMAMVFTHRRHFRH
jgi:phosphoribosylaminoimidazolecarboxamide formyltransferase/IMP cyclohydrolase